jgi:hypothetical protein
MPADLVSAFAALPTDQHGRFVPFAALCIDGERVARLDGQRVTQCYRQRLCGACGTPLGYWIVFLGADGNRAKRRFPHPPMHRECAEHLLAHDAFWSLPEAERTRAWEKDAMAVGLVGALEWKLYVTRGCEFNHRTRMFEAQPAKEIVSWP